jgi:hypothetical protein
MTDGKDEDMKRTSLQPMIALWIAIATRIDPWKSTVQIFQPIYAENNIMPAKRMV